MDIIRAFIHYNNNLVIYVSGLYGLDEAKKLAVKLKINFIDINDYFLKINNSYDKNPFSYKQLYIDKINYDIKELAKTGLIIYGFPIIDNSLIVPINFNIHIYVTNNHYVNYWKSKYPSFDENMLNREYNMYVRPYYTKLTKNLKFCKTINTNKLNQEKLFDDLYNILLDTTIKQIKKWFIKKMEKNEKKHRELNN
jgi:hypothetical protein